MDFDFDFDALENAELGEEVGTGNASKEADFMAELDRKLALIKAAKERGADMQRTPSGMLDDADFEHTPLGEEWQAKIRFRCSSLEALMKQGRGASSAEKLAKAEQELAELVAGTELVKQEIIAIHEDHKNGLRTKVNTGKTEASRNAAANQLAELKEWQDTPKWRTHLAKIASLKTFIDDLKTKPHDELSESAKRVCEQVFAEAYFGHAPNKLSGVKSLLHGINTEDFCIARYAILAGLSIEKNKERVTKDLLTGEADCIAVVGKNEDGSPRKIVLEFKSATSPTTFIAQTSESDSQYHYQVQGYMLLYGLDEARIVTNLVPTIDMPADAYDCAPEAKKIHVRTIERDEHCIRQIQKKLRQAYDYTLKFGQDMLLKLGKFY
jgi:hypothetical protein